MTLLQGPADIWRYFQLRRQAARNGDAGEPRPIRLRSLGGAAMLCRPAQDVWTFKHTFLEGLHRPPAELVEPAMIVDLGSNVGYTVADLAHRYPGARVIGVEMDTRNAELARRNTQWLGSRVQIIHAAVWIEDGEITYAGEADDAFAVTGLASAPGRRTAPAKTLQTLYRECAIDAVDYLKMDIEGAEAAIFAQPLDWAERVRLMKIELHPPATYELCEDALQRAGFRCWRDTRHHATICASRASGAMPA
jgi:FkbM family methyltransferase